MANKRREFQFKLTDEDYRAFGRYRIMYTRQGHALVNRNRLTYLISAAMIVILFSVFHVDQKFTILMYIIAAGLAVAGIFFSERMVLKQQEKAIDADKDSADRVHAAENRVVLDDDKFITYAGEDVQSFEYKAIKLIDLTEEAIYIWMSDVAIMSLPLHAFRGMDEMKETYKWIKSKIVEQGGKVAE